MNYTRKVVKFLTDLNYQIVGDYKADIFFKKDEV